MPLQATSGAASYDAFGVGGLAGPVYIEDVFSCFLYTGTGSTQTITNNINFSAKGGLVWIKGRSGATSHRLTDTIRGATKSISSETADGQVTEATGLTAFGTTGFTIGADADYNTSSATYASWSFEKQTKAFDVVTYTGTGSARTIAHNLGSAPGCIFVKCTSTGSQDWVVYHRSLGATKFLILNTTAAEGIQSTRWNDTAPTSSVFSVGGAPSTNSSGESYVAYLFAHNAGGFGLTGTDNVISCGSYTGNGSTTGPVVTLGYEPQWLMIKNSSSAGDNWVILDSMRGTGNPPNNGSFLFPNALTAETPTNGVNIFATGFEPASTAGTINQFGETYVYIAIRRGQMKVPTDATTVFGINARTGTGANATVTGSAGVSDAVLVKNRGSAVASLLAARLTGTRYLVPSTPAAQVSAGNTILQANPWDVMDGVKVGTTSTIINSSGGTFVNYLFKRAPSFMDVVCYTGDSQYGRSISHNLRVAPELIIVKTRTSASSAGFTSFIVGSKTVGGSQAPMRLDTNSATTGLTVGGFPKIGSSSTSFLITDSNDDGTGSMDSVNLSPQNYIALLFATCPGVSKVGTYTGNGTTQTINCGFTGGARFVLLKRTDATGDWYVYDTARGMSALTDPYFLLNSTAAEAATLGSVTTVSTGFALNSTILAAINVNAGTYIFLAIA
jgi:hypothetical protein